MVFPRLFRTFLLSEKILLLKMLHLIFPKGALRGWLRRGVTGLFIMMRCFLMRFCLRHEKEKELERKHVFKMVAEHEASNKSRQEHGESSKVQQKCVPPLIQWERVEFT